MNQEQGGLNGGDVFQCRGVVSDWRSCTPLTLLRAKLKTGISAGTTEQNEHEAVVQFAVLQQSSVLQPWLLSSGWSTSVIMELVVEWSGRSSKPDMAD